MGFFSNDYPKRMPFLERVGKEMRFRKAVRQSAQKHGEPQFVLVHPDWPSKRASIMAYADALGWAVTNRKGTPARYKGTVNIQLAFDDRTEKRQAQPGMWNGHCLDISKSTLDRHHREVFGYGLAVDPTAHAGPMLEKSEGNAVHDGREIQGPPRPKPGPARQGLPAHPRQPHRARTLRRPQGGGHRRTAAGGLPQAQVTRRPIHQRDG